MPTIKRIGPYRIFFYAGDKNEPPHVHIERDEKVAKFWLDPVRLQRSGGFARAEVNRIRRLIDNNRIELVEAWSDYFDD